MLSFREPFRRIHRSAVNLVGRLLTRAHPNKIGTAPDFSSNKELQTFSKLLNRYIAEASCKLDWSKVNLPYQVPYSKLAQPTDEVALLKKLAVLKVNGGLGTTMGMQGAKTALVAKNGLTFLDLVIQQIASVNSGYGVNIPLLLMTSFSTHEDTLRITQKYDSKDIRIRPFIQSKYPRIMKDSLLPYAAFGQDDKSAWYPPGHGDMYTVLHRSGMLNRLLKEGKHYLFVSNSDNLGAVVDPRILQHMINMKLDFVMEVTDKTKTDIASETLINYDGALRLIELVQVPDEHVEEFTCTRQFKIFNTNNLWIDLRGMLSVDERRRLPFTIELALKKVMDGGGMELEVIANPKTTDDGHSVIQLETSAGAAIRHFPNACGVNVPRSRFLPVKKCSDLLLIQSDLYKVEGGRVVLSEDRPFGTTPIIKLDSHFEKIHDFQDRFKAIPSVIDLDHLTVVGDVHFGLNVTLRGTVIIIAKEGQRIDIPDGCVLEDKLVSGNLNMTEL